MKVTHDDGTSYDLPRFEKNTLCFMIADESNRVEKRIAKLHERENRGGKTIFRVGEGRSDIRRGNPNPNELMSRKEMNALMEGW